MFLSKYFSLPIYVQIFKNKFVIKACDGSDKTITVTPDKPFTTTRLLVGDFPLAEATLLTGIKQLQGKGLFKKSIKAVVHPMEMTEGGLCMVEDKLFRELAVGGGAYKVAIHNGAILNQQQVIELIQQ